MAGVAAQRTVITSIVKAPILLTRIFYNFPIFTSMSVAAVGRSDQNHEFV
jgi:hypothetical protein